MNATIRSPHTKHKRPSSGFTLLEILVAIFIFSIVISTIYLSYSTLFGNADIVNNSIADLNMVGSCLERMRTDLQSIYIVQPPAFRPPGFNEEPDEFGFIGEALSEGGSTVPRIQFTTLAHVPLDGTQAAGVARVVYYLQAQEDDTFILRRADALHPFPEFEAKRIDPILCDRIVSLDITFIDGEGEPREEWNSESRDFDYATPRAVGIQLGIQRTDQEPRMFQTLLPIPVYREQRG